MPARLILFLTLFVSFFSTPSYAQLVFEQSEHDFGKMQMIDSVTHRFTFHNAGEAPIKVNAVEAECSCTVADFPSTAVEAGAQAEITVRFYPYRFGEFSKKFEVKTTAANYTLLVKGQVIRPLSKEEQFPYAKGPLNSATRYVNFGRLTTEKPVTQRVVFHNPTQETVRFSGKIDAPPYVTVKYENPPYIAPDSTGSLYITYDAAAKRDYGFVSDSLGVLLKAPEGVVMPIFLTASIEPYFPELSEEELDHYPRIALSPEKLNLGQIYRNKDSILAEVEVINTGDQPLELLKVMPGPGLELLTPIDSLVGQKLARTERLRIRMRMVDVRRTGNQQRRLTIFCNDPKQHVKVFRISARLR